MFTSIFKLNNFGNIKETWKLQNIMSTLGDPMNSFIPSSTLLYLWTLLNSFMFKLTLFLLLFTVPLFIYFFSCPRRTQTDIQRQNLYFSSQWMNEAGVWRLICLLKVLNLCLILIWDSFGLFLLRFFFSIRWINIFLEKCNCIWIKC